MRALINVIAIMQPTYLPWVGYFDLIKSVDQFIFLDNVKLEKSSWQTRNQILINNEPSLITVPVIGSRNQLISNTLINQETKWREKHISTLTQIYRKHPFGEWMLNFIIPILKDKTIISLSALNIKLIKTICFKLNIHSDFHLSSDIATKDKKSLRLIEICNFFNSINYYSPIGSKNYIIDEKFFKDSGINVSYQNLNFKEYNQHRSEKFINNLSIIDLLSNLGPDKTANYISELKK
jgi:hypothetical protein